MSATKPDLIQALETVFTSSAEYDRNIVDGFFDIARALRAVARQLELMRIEDKVTRRFPDMKGE